MTTPTTLFSEGAPHPVAPACRPQATPGELSPHDEAATWRGHCPEQEPRAVAASGRGGLDAELPGGGRSRSSLIEEAVVASAAQEATS